MLIQMLSDKATSTHFLKKDEVYSLNARQANALIVGELAKKVTPKQVQKIQAKKEK